MLAAAHNRIQFAIFAELSERRIGLRGIADCYLAGSAQTLSHPATDSFDHSRMRDDVFPMTRSRSAFIMFLDPIRFQYDPIARPNKICRQIQRTQRFFDNSMDLRPIRIARRSAIRRHYGFTESHRHSCLPEVTGNSSARQIVCPGNPRGSNHLKLASKER